nr:Transposase, Ptta/En/Spm, plant [Ipomoea batatas]
MVKSNFNDHWPTWAQFSYETKAALWAKFQEKYHWDEDKNENVYKIWYAKANKGFRVAISRGRKNACTKAGINPYDSNADWEKEKYDTALKEKHVNDSSSQVMFDADAWKCAIGYQSLPFV